MGSSLFVTSQWDCQTCEGGLPWTDLWEATAADGGGAVQGVPEDSPVVFEMELVGFQRQQHWTSLAAADKIHRAQVRP